MIDGLWRKLDQKPCQARPVKQFLTISRVVCEPLYIKIDEIPPSNDKLQKRPSASIKPTNGNRTDVERKTEIGRTDRGGENRRYNTQAKSPYPEVHLGYSNVYHNPHFCTSLCRLVCYSAYNFSSAEQEKTLQRNKDSTWSCRPFRRFNILLLHLDVLHPMLLPALPMRKRSNTTHQRV